MTVASQIKQTLASLKGAEATVETYAAHHPDPQVKRELQECRQRLDLIVQELKVRIQEIELEEPQFKGF